MRRFAALTVLLVGCSSSQSNARSSARDTAGTEGAECRPPGKLNACKPGLDCVSNVCVRPPLADCANVGETLATIDLGNTAKPEERTPVVAKYKAACEVAHPSVEQGECFDKAPDRQSALHCAPQLFSESTSSERACQGVADRIEAVLKDNAQGQQWMTTKRVMQQSCNHDKWPDALKDCMMNMPVGPDAMQACDVQTPPVLKTKILERLQAAK